MTSESQALSEARHGQNNWKKWGPYLSERPWGTVREDCFTDRYAWDYFSHHQAQRADCWGEDGLDSMADEPAVTEVNWQPEYREITLCLSPSLGCCLTPFFNVSQVFFQVVFHK